MLVPEGGKLGSAAVVAVAAADWQMTGWAPTTTTTTWRTSWCCRHRGCRWTCPPWP